MNSKYNIAIVGGSLSSFGGGAPRSIAQQAAIMSRAGHHVELFVGYSRKYPLTVEQFSCTKCKVTSSRLWGPSVLGLFPGALLTLWKNAPSFDVIHLNGAWNLTTFLGALIARSRKIPYIITMRGHFGEYHFKRKPLMKKILFQLLEKHNIRHAYAMHATARWEVDTSARALQYAREVIVIPNPVDLTDFQQPPTRAAARKKLGLKDSDFHIIHLGRLAKQKNLPFLIEAFAKAELGSDSFLTFVGPPEPDLKKQLEELTAQRGLSKQLRFIDFAKGEQRCNWLAAADLFALPSFDENFCIVAVESVASGTHCLLSPNVGAIEFLPAHLMEILPLTPDTWVKSLIQNHKTRPPQQIPTPADLHRFSSEEITRQWIDFYSKLTETPVR